MSKHSLVSRDIFGDAGISLHDFRTGVLPKRDYPKIPIACEPLSEHPYWIDDQSSLSPIQLRSKCNYIKARTGLDLIIIDYLQLMYADGRHDSRRAEIEYISRSLKEIAKEFDVPLIALSQLSRGPEARKPPKPLLSDLRESGSIEQDADAVLFIYRAEQYSSKAEYKNKGELILAKQRNGPVGTVHVGYNKKSIKFFDLTKDDKDDITKHWSDDS
jgi:replicative DNA helicase